ncbi:MAG: type III-B CRISPR module-associated protein Cmr5 [Gammaproteobacteria bacterium]|nr:type III-B CRISPR module-associated protein Cmr5 [Gammaproteobacteria bacterium]MBU1655810.1 type III-B CRISPR module-associated protein Cmr5 [Gammaproteobacteria bacterium]MBU1960201.1 type III-B CRISPR module-associated protein Cmr5 [Gammaproteobacteria bacterium]
MPELRAHKIARAAYERVTAHSGSSEGFRKKYAALAHKLPGMILQNGLAQATGFLLAKGKEEHRAVLTDLAGLLRAIGATNSSDPDQLHRSIIDADLEQTLLLTRRALEATGWMKRYIQGALGLSATGESIDSGEARP